MNPIRLLLCQLLLVCATNPVFARKEYLFSFDSTLQFKKPVSFNAIKVVDLRPDTTSVGHLSETFDNRDIAFNGNLSHALEGFGLQLIGNKENKANTLVVVLRQLQIVPTTTDKLTTVYIAAEFYRGTADQYQYLFTADTFYEASKKRADVDQVHSKTWERMLDRIWYQYFEHAGLYPQANINDGTTYSLTTALKRLENKKTSYPVYQENTYPVGVYFTREEFLNLKPGLTNFKDEENPDGSTIPHRFYKVNENGKRGERIDERQYYAVYNGKHWYKTASNGVYLLRKDKDDFYFAAAMNGLMGKQDNYVAALGFGAIGVAIVEIAKASNTNSTKQASINYHIRLDAETGRFIAVRRLGQY